MLLIRLQGNFYNAYDDDAKVLSVLMGYKIRERSSGKLRCGFPIEGSASERVADTLRSNHVSFKIMIKDETVSEAEYDDDAFAAILSEFDEKMIIPYKAVEKNNMKKAADSNREEASEPRKAARVQDTLLLVGSGYDKMDSLKMIKEQLDKTLDAGHRIVNVVLIEANGWNESNRIGGIAVVE